MVVCVNHAACNRMCVQWTVSSPASNQPAIYCTSGIYLYQRTRHRPLSIRKTLVVACSAVCVFIDLAIAPTDRASVSVVYLTFPLRSFYVGNRSPWLHLRRWRRIPYRIADVLTVASSQWTHCCHLADVNCMLCWQRVVLLAICPHTYTQMWWRASI
jgi:hypothetical protein